METIKGTHLESMSVSEILVDQSEVRVRNYEIKTRIECGKSRKTRVSNCYW